MESKVRSKSGNSKVDVESRPSPGPAAPFRGPSSPLQQLQHTLGNRGVGRFLQAKLQVSQPGDSYEQEADRVADQVMRMPDAVPLLTSSPIEHSPAPAHLQRACAKCEEADEDKPEIHRQAANVTGERGLQTRSVHGSVGAQSAEAAFNNATRGGEPLSEGARSYFEPRFGHDFSGVRIHRDERAATSASAVSALAYTIGHDIFFGSNQFAPETTNGKTLLAHELAHTIQQSAAGQLSEPTLQRYTPEERRAMAEGRVVGEAADLALAQQRHFQPADIVFRSGSSALGLITSEPVTHGGIYIGGGLIHDAVAFGNRHVRVSNFFSTALNEAADSSIYKVVRFRGPHRELITTRLLRNISQRDFRMPTDPVPFNLFSSAGDYRTATCLEYAHAQFLYAIRQLSQDQAVSSNERQSLRSTYFTGNAVEPNPLIKPREQSLIGSTPDLSMVGTNSGIGGGQTSRTLSAPVQEAALIAAASAMASDVDPSKFSNRSESHFSQHWPGGSGIGGTILNLLMGMAYDEVVLPTFTYRSFVDSRQFFEDVTS